jgi:Ca-activated chloride channel family protein
MRMTYYTWSIILCALCSSTVAWAQADYPWLRTGDELYNQRAFTEAETAYRKAQEEKEKPTTSFNLGNSIYSQNRIPEAIQQYEKSIAASTDPQLKSKAWYNLGNAHYQNQDFAKSIQAYKEALKLQPQDEDAKKNLTLAMRQQQQQQQQQDQQNKDNTDQQQQQQQQEQQDQQQDQSSSSQQQEQQQDQKQTAEEISKDEARDILKAIEREDQRVQEKLKKAAGKSAPPVKDW